MAKQGMSRPETTHTKPRNDVSPVAEIQGKAKHGKVRANPIIAGRIAWTSRQKSRYPTFMPRLITILQGIT